MLEDECRKNWFVENEMQYQVRLLAHVIIVMIVCVHLATVAGNQ